MKIIRCATLVILTICMVGLETGRAQGQSRIRSKALLNVDSRGVGAHGYDPVGFFTEGKAIKGDSRWQSTFGGAIYYFQSSASKDVFDRDPAKYAPQYGGHCSMAMTMGKLEDADPNYFLVHNGKLLLQRNERAHMMFSRDPEGNRKKADDNWSKLEQAQQAAPN